MASLANLQRLAEGLDHPEGIALGPDGLLTVAGPAIAKLRARLPVITACVLIALGLVTLASRWRDAGPIGVTAPSCHMQPGMHE